MGRKFIVYILTDDPHKKDVDNLYKCFDSAYFITKIITLRNQTYHIDDTLTEKDINEMYRIDTALLKSQKKYNKLYTIVLKDTSKLQVSNDQLYDILNDAVKYNEHTQEWDICYLCRWLDRCDKCSLVKHTNKNINIMETHSPHGMQSLIFSPEGRDKILGIKPMNCGNYFTPVKVPLDTKINADIEYGSLNAITYSSNIFQYDTKHAYRDSDYVKYSQCRIPEPEKVHAYSVIIYIIVILATLLLVWIFHKVRTRYDCNYKKKSSYYNKNRYNRNNIIK